MKTTNDKEYEKLKKLASDADKIGVFETVPFNEGWTLLCGLLENMVDATLISGIPPCCKVERLKALREIQKVPNDWTKGVKEALSLIREEEEKKNARQDMIKEL